MKHVIQLIFFSLASLSFGALAKQSPNQASVLEHYANIAYLVYSDSLIMAKELDKKIKVFVDNPTPANHQAAKAAWKNARVPYGQTEVFRFGNPNVDDWEGRVNAWPLDEGLIDYVEADYEFDEGNPHALENIIAGDENINVDLLRGYHEKSGAEANVATGYHAIEFLLWGQDLNAAPVDAGLRSHTDFLQGEPCTHGNCDRRGKYLLAVSALLVSDLEEMVNDWAPGRDNYRRSLTTGDEDEGIRKIIFGMGSLSLGELAGERMNVALLANSQEDEHSCFSDNTHIDIQANAQGIQNIYLGEYVDINGRHYAGTSLSDLVASTDKDLDMQLLTQLNDTAAKVETLVSAASTGEPFDQQIAEDNTEGNARVKSVINALKTQTTTLEKVASAIGIDDLRP